MKNVKMMYEAMEQAMGQRADALKAEWGEYLIHEEKGYLFFGDMPSLYWDHWCLHINEAGFVDSVEFEEYDDVDED